MNGNTTKKCSKENIIFSDICDKSNKKIYYCKLKDGSESIAVETSNITDWGNSQYINSMIKDVFLPKGYPLSVSSDYLEYQIWDTCQAFCSSICGALTVRAVMEGIGVGSKSASPISAALTWIMKDGTGMLGSILFAWLQGSKLDSDCKKWRLFADILNDIAMFVELLIPTVINYSIYMLCIATVFKALVGTAGSSTRAALITHQAIQGNIADVSAKDGSQELFTNLFAFVFSIFLLKNITETHQIWTVMCIAATFHIFFNYKAVRCLKMNVFNGERLRLILRTYLPTSSIPTIEQVNRRESVFLGMGMSEVQLCGFKIVFGDSLNEAVKSQNLTCSQLSVLVTIFQDKKYFILAELKKKVLYVTFRIHFTDIDVLKAYFHAVIIGVAISFLQSNKQVIVLKRARKNSPLYRLKNILEGFLNVTLDEKVQDQNDLFIQKAYLSCEDFIEKEFSAFCNLCIEENWNVQKHLININDWRSDWKYVPPSGKNDIPLKRIAMKIYSQPKNEKRRKSSVPGSFSSLTIS